MKMTQDKLTRLTEVLSVPTHSRNEKLMIEYLQKVLTEKGYDHYTDSHGNIYVTKGNSKNFPCFVAHTDTVHPVNLNMMVIQTESEQDGVILTGIDKVTRKASGIGGDDKCGIYICLELLRQLDKVKIAFFVSEETGCHGSKMLNTDFLNDVGYITQYDAPGDHLISYSCMGTVLFDEKSEFFKIAYRSISEGFGNDMLVQSHPYTDIMIMKQKSDLSCINMSCGYYNMHTANEFVCISDVERAITAGMNMVKNLGLKKYEFKPEPKPTTTTTTFSDFEDENPFYDQVHQLTSIDVIEDRDGIIILDFYDENRFFIDDEDGYKLYEILKNRYSLDEY